MFELHTLLLVTCGYLAIIFIVAFAAENQWLPDKLLNHPLIYTLSLGGYIGTWAVYGVFGQALTGGYTFLAYYFGTSALFIFAPLILQPLLSLSRTYQLSSIADLFSFRYCSQWAGILVTLGTLIAILPIMALQINAIAESASFLHNFSPENADAASRALSILFCSIITLFTIRFGSRHINVNVRHEGLIVAIAFQALIILLIFLALGCIAIYTVFGTPVELESWLYANPERLELLNQSLVSNSPRTLVLIFFAAAVAFPHMYHLAIAENRNPKSLNYASWAFPLYLLLLSLPILPILWASVATDSHDSGYFFTLALGTITSTPSLSILAYICGMAAASASMMVIIISVASMCLNHLVLPFFPPHKKNNTYKWLRLVKSLLMIALVVISYLSYEIIKSLTAFNAFGFAAYTAAFQFLPGILAVFYWPKGNRIGLISGLIVGFTAWGVTILLPIISTNALGLDILIQTLFSLNESDHSFAAAITCLGINMLTFGGVSLFTKTNEEQRTAAKICTQDDLNRPMLQHLSLNSADQFIEKLSDIIGTDAADREVHNALTELNMTIAESRPFALRLLRRQLESNLSGLFGPTVARQIVTEYLPYQKSLDETTAKEDIQLIEHHLENYQSHFTGLAAELDNLRRYHRNTVEHLPLGVCTLNDEQEILMWNKSMEQLTGITTSSIVGSPVTSLNEPWPSFFTEFLVSDESQSHKQQLSIDGTTRWFSLHKTTLPEKPTNSENKTILLEEVTALIKLEQELLHNERLASIGRLAAGVAHEIGNPITGIACLAQNLKYDSDSPEINEAAKDILTQTERVTRIVQSLVNFSHAGTHSTQFQAEAVNLHLCADDAIHLLSLDQRIIVDNIHNNINKQHIVEADTQSLLQVFINLLKNSLDACNDNSDDADTNISIILESAEHDHTVELKITDNGPGIPKNLQEHIFDPFYTTKDPGEGTGLGLSLVYGIIEDHYGQIQVISPIDSNSDSGTSFIIHLPKALSAKK